MIKKISYFLIALTLSSCQFLGLEKKNPTSETPIAKVYNSYLYKEDIEKLIPKNIEKQDSILLAKSIISNWAKQHLLLYKAEQNLTQENSEKYAKLVEDYKQSLLVNGYKERLIKQQLDTVISSQEIQNYYELNKSNFKLNEDLLKIKYLHFGNAILDKKGIINLFKSEDHDDLLTLESQGLNFKEISLNDSTWVKLDDVLLKISKFIEIPKENLLKKTKFIQKEDSLGVYLMSVKDVLKRNDIAPLSYITPTIKQMILHKRKLELIREIEKTLLNDAIQNKNFTEY